MKCVWIRKAYLYVTYIDQVNGQKQEISTLTRNIIMPREFDFDLLCLYI